MIHCCKLREKKVYFIVFILLLSINSIKLHKKEDTIKPKIHGEDRLRMVREYLCNCARALKGLFPHFCFPLDQTMTDGLTSGTGDKKGLMVISVPWTLRSWSPNPLVTPIVANKRAFLPSPNTKGNLRSSSSTSLYVLENQVKWVMLLNFKRNLHLIAFFPTSHLNSFTAKVVHVCLI